MDLDTILHEDLVFIQKDFSSAKEVITFLSKKLLEKGYVKEGFLPAVLEREEKLPTGLYLGSINVAIPHTDVKHVVKQTIAIVTLKSPVKFGKMDNPEKKILVHIVFLLAVADPKGYVKFLSKLTGSFNNKLFIKKIYNGTRSREIIEQLKETLQDVKQ